ncbi:MAG: glycosyltransferase family 39 protein [Candidatus Omnitrophica bacterium]|nr:glycosyltransferase family 39 protein [Candidatus Omnitrophota bacterium]
MKRSGWTGLAIILLFSGVLVHSTFRQVQYQPQADEGHLLAYASRVAQGGLRVWPELFKDYLAGAETNQYHPSPTRLTTILAQAAAVRLRGPEFRSLSELSLASFLAFLAVMFAGLYRTFGEKTALWTTLLLAVSPLHMGMARRALGDSLTALLFTASFWLLLANLAKAPAKRWWLLSALYTAAFLSKESTLLLTPVSLVFLFWKARRGRAPTLLSVCAVSVIPAAAAFLLTGLAAGSFSIAWQTEWAFTHSAKLSRYAMLYDQGPWFLYLADLILLSPWVAFLYAGWLGHLTASREKEEFLWRWALLPVFFVAFTCLLPARNIRHLLLIEAPVRLGAVLFLQGLFGGWAGRGRRQELVMGAVVLMLASLDLKAFHDLFLVHRFYDPVSFWLLYWRGFLPQ